MQVFHMRPQEPWQYLDTRVCEVTFIKADGTERVLLCTKSLDLIPAVDHPLRENYVDPKPGLHRVYDVEKKAWRSFNEDSVIVFNYGD